MYISSSLFPLDFFLFHKFSFNIVLGRSFHTIASGSYDKTVRIWQLFINNNSEMTYKEVCNEDLHNSVVWSVEWNITGTILASSGLRSLFCSFSTILLSYFYRR